MRKSSSQVLGGVDHTIVAATVAGEMGIAEMQDAKSAHADTLAVVAAQPKSNVAMSSTGTQPMVVMKTVSREIDSPMS